MSSLSQRPQLLQRGHDRFQGEPGNARRQPALFSQRLVVLCRDHLVLGVRLEQLLKLPHRRVVDARGLHRLAEQSDARRLVIDRRVEVLRARVRRPRNVLRVGVPVDQRLGEGPESGEVERVGNATVGVGIEIQRDQHASMALDVPVNRAVLLVVDLPDFGARPRRLRDRRVFRVRADREGNILRAELLGDGLLREQRPLCPPARLAEDAARRDEEVFPVHVLRDDVLGDSPRGGRDSRGELASVLGLRLLRLDCLGLSLEPVPVDAQPGNQPVLLRERDGLGEPLVLPLHVEVEHPAEHGRRDAGHVVVLVVVPAHHVDLGRGGVEDGVFQVDARGVQVELLASGSRALLVVEVLRIGPLRSVVPVAPRLARRLELLLPPLGRALRRLGEVAFVLDGGDGDSHQWRTPSRRGAGGS
jgi:hypothetical protein